MDAVFAELDRVRRETPPLAEVERAKASIYSAFNAAIATRAGMLRTLRFVDEHNLGDAWFADHVKRLAAVTPERVQAMAIAQLDPSRMSIAVVGDRVSVEPQIARLRAGTR
jgi:predicted Zn-dependent peptidase